MITDGEVERNSVTFSPANAPLPFSFPGKLAIVALTNESPTPVLNQVVELAGGDGAVISPESPLSLISVQNAFHKLAEENYSSFSGSLKCGNLECKVILSPTPMVCKSLFKHISLIELLNLIKYL